MTQLKTATSQRLGGFTLIAVATFTMFLLSICLGSVNFSLSEVLQTLLGHGDANAVHRQIILDFRLPQVLTALLSGAALGTAGLLMQTVFRNPLADPFNSNVSNRLSENLGLLGIWVGSEDNFLQIRVPLVEEFANKD